MHELMDTKEFEDTRAMVREMFVEEYGDGDPVPSIVMIDPALGYVVGNVVVLAVGVEPILEKVLSDEDRVRFLRTCQAQTEALQAERSKLH